MSEETTTEQQSTPGQPTADESSHTETKPRPKDLPPDQEWDHVEFTEQQQRRFNRLYAKEKENDRLIRQMGEENRKLFERLEGLETSQQEQAVKRQIADLRVSEKAALESQEFDHAAQIRDQITDLQVEAKLPKEKPKKPEVPRQSEWMERNGPRINDWVNERDDKGELKRPWADPGHAEHGTALAAAKVVMEGNMDADIEDVLKKIDEVNARVIPKRSSPPVLSATTDASPKKGKPQLSDDEKKIAAAMGMSPDRYAKMQQKLAGANKYVAGT
jgi:hypothetical protein